MENPNNFNKDPKLEQERKANMDLAKVAIELELANKEVGEAEKNLDEKKDKLFELNIKKIELEIENAKRVELYPKEDVLNSDTENMFGYSLEQEPLVNDFNGHEVVVLRVDELLEENEYDKIGEGSIEVVNKIIKKYKNKYYFPGLEYYKIVLGNNSNFNDIDRCDYNLFLGSIRKSKEHTGSQFEIPGITSEHYSELYPSLGSKLKLEPIKLNIDKKLPLPYDDGIVLIKREKPE